MENLNLLKNAFVVIAVLNIILILVFGANLINACCGWLCAICASIEADL